MSPPRPATREDLGAVLDLLDALNARGQEQEPRYRLRADARERLRATLREDWFGSFLPFPACWVVGRDRPVGLVSGLVVREHPILERPPTASIDNLFVHADHRGRGHARRLVDAFCRAAADAGYPRMDVGTLAADTEAVSFWHAMGFTDLRLILSRP